MIQFFSSRLHSISWIGDISVHGRADRLKIEQNTNLIDTIRQTVSIIIYVKVMLSYRHAVSNTTKNIEPTKPNRNGGTGWEGTTTTAQQAWRRRRRRHQNTIYFFFGSAKMVYINQPIWNLNNGFLASTKLTSSLLGTGTGTESAEPRALNSEHIAKIKTMSTVRMFTLDYVDFLSILLFAYFLVSLLCRRSFSLHRASGTVKSVRCVMYVGFLLFLMPFHMAGIRSRFCNVTSNKNDRNLWRQLI